MSQRSRNRSPIWTSEMLGYVHDISEQTDSLMESYRAFERLRNQIQWVDRKPWEEFVVEMEELLNEYTNAEYVLPYTHRTQIYPVIHRRILQAFSEGKFLVNVIEDHIDGQWNLIVEPDSNTQERYSSCPKMLEKMKSALTYYHRQQRLRGAISRGNITDYMVMALNQAADRWSVGFDFGAGLSPKKGGVKCAICFGNIHKPKRIAEYEEKHKLCCNCLCWLYKGAGQSVPSNLLGYFHSGIHKLSKLQEERMKMIFFHKVE